MTTQLIARLRAAAAHPYNQHGPNEFLAEAADLLETFWAKAISIAEREAREAKQAALMNTKGSEPWSHAMAQASAADFIARQLREEKEAWSLPKAPARK